MWHRFQEGGVVSFVYSRNKLSPKTRPTPIGDGRRCAGVLCNGRGRNEQQQHNGVDQFGIHESLEFLPLQAIGKHPS